MIVSKFYTWYSAQSNALKAIIIFSLTTLIISIIFLINLWIMYCVAERVMEPIYQSDQLLESRIQDFKKPPSVPVDYFTVLKTQEEFMDQRKNHHWALAKIFFRNYYSILFLSVILSCVGALTLFALINRGWATAGITLQSFFMTLATALTFVGFFPVVFKQQDNFSQNMLYYENYSKGEIAIYGQLSGLLNPTLPTRSDSKDPLHPITDSAQFYRHLDTLVATNNNLISSLTNYVLTIDPTQLKSMGDIYHMLQDDLKNTADTTQKK